MPRFRFPKVLVPLSPLVLLSATLLMPMAVSAAPAQVVIGGTLIHTIRNSWAGHSAQHRADAIQQRLIVAIAQGPIHPKDITVAKLQDDWCVLLRGKRLLTADAQAAKQQHAEASALAEEWAAYLRQVLPDLTKPQ